MMAREKADRLGLRGTLALYESAYRIVGGANATGAITGGAAFHAFKETAVQTGVKTAIIFFLFGVLGFAFAYLLWFITSLEVDLALDEPEDKKRPERVLLPGDTKKTRAESEKSARLHFRLSMLFGIISLICFLAGIGRASEVVILLVKRDGHT